MIRVYFHGQPGSPQELALAAPGMADLIAPDLIAPDRAAERPEFGFSDYLDHLAQTILAKRASAGSASVHLIGFSCGAFVAVETALRLQQHLDPTEIRLDLISAAAPLDLGDFLPHMAGGAVFSAARDRPAAFALLTSAQGLMARLAPGFLYGQIFATAAGADKGLAASPDFRKAVIALLRSTLKGGAQGYRREVLAYVRWTRSRLSGLKAQTTLWHGTEDTWTPPAMGEALAKALPNLAAINRLEGLSHYSTLIEALPGILAKA